MIAAKSYKKRCSSTKKIWLAAIACLPFLLFACSSDLGQKYSRDPVTEGAFGKLQEDALSSLLQRYVDPDARVNYAAWRASSNDVAALKNVLSAIAVADTRPMSAQEAKSFYINAYNAMTIDLILSHFDETLGGASSPYPNDRSIRNIGNLDDNVWNEFKWKVGGRSVSLNELENNIIRPMGDARIHFAIVCAAKGCPPLLNRAFSTGSIEQTLDQLTDGFVNSGKKTEFRLDTKQIKTSHIIEWFSGDFDQSYGSVKSFFAKYVTVVPADQVQGMSISYFPYDWTLNEPTVATPATPTPEPTPPGSGTETPPGSGTETPPLNSGS